MPTITVLPESGQSKTLNVYQLLRRRIVNLEMRPSEFIRKDDLTKEFGVSRAPINDALARLREDGLVDIAPQHGSFVAPIRVNDVREGMFVRRVLEPAAVRRVAADAADKLADKLGDNLDRQRSAVAKGDTSVLYQLDEEFHGLILTSVNLSHSRKFLMTFSAHLMRARNLTIEHQSRAGDTVDEHGRIVEAIVSGDPDWAASEMDSHLAAAYAALTKMVTPDNIKDDIEIDKSNLDLSTAHTKFAVKA